MKKGAGPTSQRFEGVVSCLAASVPDLDNKGTLKQNPVTQLYCTNKSMFSTGGQKAKNKTKSTTVFLTNYVQNISHVYLY